MPIKQYDVLIVGSAHSGGMAANILTQKGISCLMLNAGPEADFERDRDDQGCRTNCLIAASTSRAVCRTFSGERVQCEPVGGREGSPVHASARRSPTTGCACACLAADRLFWARQSFRLSDLEFKAADIDGTGENWPISHGRSGAVLLAEWKRFSV